MTEETLQQRSYQDEGVAFLRSRKRAMLTDRPGLGKTAQAVLAAESPTLVVCPKYLVGQWEAWLQKYRPSETVSTCRGDRFKKTRLIKPATQWTIINIEMLRTHFEELKARQHNDPFQTLILDESHHLRNKDAIRSKHAATLAKSIPRVYELTATPIWREVDDLWMQLHILQPDIFRSYYHFVDTFCIADSSRFGTKVLGVKKDMLPVLEQLLSVVRLGRSYEEAGRELPPMIEKIVKIDLPEKIAITYKQAVNHWIEEIEEGFTSYASVLHALRQITAGYHKAQAVVECLGDINVPALIFTWYRETAHLLGSCLPGSTVITGEMSVEERRRQALAGKSHIIATISSLSEGIDLSHFRTVIFAEEHWPPGANDQALSRVRRERQTESNEDPVLVYYVMAKDTVDEVIHNVSQRRQANIKDVMEGAGLL